MTNEEKALKISRQTGLDYNNVLQGLQMADVEFQMAIAPYSGYEGPIDPSIARYHSLPKGAQSGLLGFATSPDAPNHYISAGVLNGDDLLIPAEPGTVNVVGARGATPATWAHEYSHQLEKDRSLYKQAKAGDKIDIDALEAYIKFGSGNAQEVNQRFLDLRGAQNMDDVFSAVDYIANEELRRLERQIDRAFEEDDVETARELFDKTTYLVEDIINNPTEESVKDYIKTTLSDVNKEYDKIGSFKSNLFKKLVNDNEQRAKTAKTFKESLD